MIGVDVSDNNTVTSWNLARVKSHIQFAFVKVTQGGAFHSIPAPSQLTGAGMAGLKLGAYHFADSSATLTAQISNYLAHVPQSVTMAALDVEGAFLTYIGADLTAWSNAFLRSVKQTRPDLDLYLYTNRQGLAGHDWTTVSSVAHLWYANPSGSPVPPSAFGAPTITQGAAATVAGISGPVDIDTMTSEVTPMATEQTYRVSDYRTPDTKAKLPYTLRTLTEGELLAQNYIMLTQLTEKLVRS